MVLLAVRSKQATTSRPTRWSNLAHAGFEKSRTFPGYAVRFAERHNLSQFLEEWLVATKTSGSPLHCSIV